MVEFILCHSLGLLWQLITLKIVLNKKPDNITAIRFLIKLTQDNANHSFLI